MQMLFTIEERYIVSGSESHSNHHPHCAYVFWVWNNLNSDRMLDLISSRYQYIFTHFIAIEVMHHALSVKVSELHRECFKSVAVRNVVFDCLLKFIIGKGDSTDSLHLIVGEC